MIWNKRLNILTQAGCVYGKFEICIKSETCGAEVSERNKAEDNSSGERYLVNG